LHKLDGWFHTSKRGTWGGTDTSYNLGTFFTPGMLFTTPYSIHSGKVFLKLGWSMGLITHGGVDLIWFKKILKAQRIFYRFFLISVFLLKVGVLLLDPITS
jgi:hypothetical protein